MAENRRYLKLLIPGWLKELELQRTERRLGLLGDHMRHHRSALRRDGGARRQGELPHALWQIGEAVAEVFADVVQLQPTLQDLPGDAPPWHELTRRCAARNNHEHQPMPLALLVPVLSHRPHSGRRTQCAGPFAGAPYRLCHARTGRVSSWDRTGDNRTSSRSNPARQRNCCPSMDRARSPIFT